MSEPFEAATGLRLAVVSHRDRGWLRIDGADAVRFLHAMLSNDVVGLPVGGLRPALLLDRKGHVTSMLLVLREEAQLWLDTSPGTAGRVREALEKHVIADDVRIEDRSADAGLLAIEGPDARARCAELGFPTPEPDRFEVGAKGELWCARGVLDAQGLCVRGSVERLAEIREQLAAPVLETDRVAALHVALGVPRFGIDVTERNFPQEARLEREAVSFRKGCYVGQEIVARIQSRGAVNRLLVRLHFDGPVEVGAELTSEVQPRLGSLTSVAPAPTGSGYVALGYVKAEHARPGLPVTAGAVGGHITGPGS